MNGDNNNLNLPGEPLLSAYLKEHAKVPLIVEKANTRDDAHDLWLIHVDGEIAAKYSMSKTELNGDRERTFHTIGYHKNPLLECMGFSEPVSLVWGFHDPEYAGGVTHYVFHRKDSHLHIPFGNHVPEKK